MKRHASSLLILFFSLQAPGQFAVQKASELIDAYVKMEKINGAVLVARKGNILFKEGYGYKDVTGKTMNDVNTIFQIGSVTKQFTSAVIMQLEQEKKLSVQDKLAKYFPNFPRGADITIENLLTHTSGIYNYTGDTAFMKNQVTVPHSHEEMMALFMNKPLGFEPGTKWEYSNSNYVLLGYIIEKVTAKPYEQAVRERILAPLKMNSSGFDFAHLANPGKATGYFRLGKIPQQAPVIDSTASFAAGALYTTVGDLFKWDRGLYTNQVLSPESRRKVFTPYKHKYGYGWIIDSAFSRLFVAHGGGIYGFTSYIMRFPTEETVIILLDNSSSSSLEAVARNLAAIVFDQPYQLPEIVKEISVPESILKSYVGEYELKPDFIITISSENGSLALQATGQPKLSLHAQSENIFFIKEVDIKIEFVRDENGMVTKLIVHQTGMDLPAKKTK